MSTNKKADVNNVIRIKPNDQVAEKAVLGAVLLEDSLLPRLLTILQGRDFFLSAHQTIFAAFVSLAIHGKRIDPITVKSELEQHDALEKAGGIEYLVSLTDNVSTPDNLEHYANKVRETAISRRLSHFGNFLTIEADESDSSLSELFGMAQAKLSGLMEEYNPESRSNRFEIIGEGLYRLSFLNSLIVFEIDRLRRERHELIGELSVKCSLPGTSAFDGSLSIADFNLSSARSRRERADTLADLSNLKDIEWNKFIEEFSQRVLAAEREGSPVVDLRDIPKSSEDDCFYVDGLALPRRHPSIVFGDGGSAKSYLMLYLAGRLAQQGVRVALFDWELAGEDHRERLERLFGDEMPTILYARCEKPLTHELDRLKRIVAENKIEFSFYDSIVFACDGPAGADETPQRYFGAIRQIGGGSLHVAHITKDGSDDKPFGSTFWSNAARATWFVKLVESTTDDWTPGSDSGLRSLGLFPRKANLNKLPRPLSFEISFKDDRTTFRRTDLAENPELVMKLSVEQKMIHALKRGSMTMDELAKVIEVSKNTVVITVRRKSKLFVMVDGGKVALIQRVTE